MNDDAQSTPHPANAHPARVYNVWLGGKDHYQVDQEAARLAARANPTIVPSVRANRAFLGRAVRHLAAAGIRQFLDVGTGIPAADNTHEVAQRAVPEARVVYVDNDPIVLSHARALLVSGPDGQTAYVQADARDVDTILEAASRTLDLDEPVGLMLVAILQYIKDSEDPWDITRRLLDRLAPGSCLVLSHPAVDVTAPEVAESMRIYNERAAGHASATPRTREEVERFCEGLEILEPGVVTLTRWRPGPTDVPDDTLPMWCVVARKP
ncbi:MULTISPECIES: SAM-dependent methyltransferase [Streptomyces]|uniref:SAM-dependent methyltransferase n=2 Tax=Streptomyces TaxID=1883 RepID=A0ABU2RH67_9ACTN|nr:MULTISPECIES: SAM-dependent methyltransferase [unclassified Streptomyces]MBK3595081.1 SAM-dependent methyltransferase [Streptomyces sp. MBT51]MDT0426823.1 SAM-dependent methyltransferase [Streptomyces sp. DSM 41770]